MNERNRLILLGIGAIAVAVLIGLAFVFFGPESNDSKTAATKFNISEKEASAIDKTVTDFVKISGNFGIPKEKINWGFLNDTVMAPHELTSDTKTRAQVREEVFGLLASTSKMRNAELTEENPFIVYNVSTSKPSVTVPDKGFYTDGNVKNVTVKATFTVEKSLYQLPQESTGTEWQRTYENVNQDTSFLLTKENGKWKVVSISGLTEDCLLGVNSGEIPYFEGKLEIIKEK